MRWLHQAIHPVAVLGSISLPVHSIVELFNRWDSHRLGNSMLLGGPTGLFAHSQGLGLANPRKVY